LFVGVLHLVSDDEDPYGIVADMVNATVPGSYLALTHAAKDINVDEVRLGVEIDRVLAALTAEPARLHPGRTVPPARRARAAPA
jgi:S-adenosyl methyltransferase